MNKHAGPKYQELKSWSIFEVSKYHTTFTHLFPRLEYCLQLAAMLDSLLGVQHHHRVAPDHRHADGVPLPGLWGVNMIMISHDDTL